MGKKFLQRLTFMICGGLSLAVTNQASATWPDTPCDRACSRAYHNTVARHCVKPGAEDDMICMLRAARVSAQCHRGCPPA